MAWGVQNFVLTLRKELQQFELLESRGRELMELLYGEVGPLSCVSVPNSCAGPRACPKAHAHKPLYPCAVDASQIHSASLCTPPAQRPNSHTPHPT